MAMYPCNRCFENMWEYRKLDDGWIEATCSMCGQNVMFESKQKKNAGAEKITSDDQPCRRCGDKLYWHSMKLNKKRQQKTYHFCKWLKCRKCHEVFFVEEYKVLRGNDCGCEKTNILLNFNHETNSGEITERATGGRVHEKMYLRDV